MPPYSAAEAGFIVIFSTFILSYATQTAGAPRPAVLLAVVLSTVCTLLLCISVKVNAADAEHEMAVRFRPSHTATRPVSAAPGAAG